MTRDAFLRLLFDDGQQTCFTDDPHGYRIFPAPVETDLFFSINAIDAEKDNCPTEDWHRPNLPRRADGNVTCFRNFLIEIDNMPLEQQMPYVLDKIPVSAITFSGKKSYHFIISLMTPKKNLEEYLKMSRAIHRLLTQADKSTKNPSRLSRLPGVIRPDTGLLQELVYLGDRIYDRELPEFPKSPYSVEQPKQVNKMFVTQQIRQVQEIGVDNYISTHFSGRNQFFYWLGRRCSELGHTRDQKKRLVESFYNQLGNKSGFSIKEAYLAARVKYE